MTLHEVRGLAGQSLHTALLEIDAVSKGTRCQQPLFSVSFNPPPEAEVSENQFDRAFAKLEGKLGLIDQPRVVVYHEKEGRRHCHVVWSRIDVDNMRAINMAHFKRKCTEVSRQLYLEHGWQMPKGLQNKAERDPHQLDVGEWQRLKRRGIDPKDLKTIIRSAWQASDNAESFKTALEERGLFLARGDKRGFVVMDHTENVFSLSRHGGLKAKYLKARLGEPNDQPTLAETGKRIRSIYNKEALAMIRSLKNQHKAQLLPLEQKKAEMVKRQHKERFDLQQKHRQELKAQIRAIRSRFRRGVMGFFNVVTGRNKWSRLIGRKHISELKSDQRDARQKLILLHNQERTKLQKNNKVVKSRQVDERMQLTKHVLTYMALGGSERGYAKTSDAYETLALKHKPGRNSQDNLRKTGERIVTKNMRRNRRRNMD